MNTNPLKKAVKAAMFAGAAMMITVPAAYAADTVEEIVVTGSRIIRADLEAVSPFSVISGEEFKISGNLNIEQKLAELPNTLPSFGPSSNNPGDGTARVDLRGLGTSRTLVLVNGRRYIPATQTGVVDLNSIPGTLIKQVDVLTGGASAVYGSDALAGVVNFQMVDDFEGAEITGLYDITTDGDAEKWNTDLTIGGNFADGRGNAVAYASIADRKSLFQGDRSFSDVALRESGGTLIPGGSSGIPGTRLFGGNTADPDGIPGSGDEYTHGRFGVDGGALPWDNVADRFNYAPDNFLQLPQERVLLSTMAHFDVTDNSTVYSELTFSRNKVPQELAPTPAFTGSFQVNPNSPFFTDVTRRAFANFDDYNADGITDAADVTERQADYDAENADPDNIADPDYVPYTATESAEDRDAALLGADTNEDGMVDNDDLYTVPYIGRRMVENGSRQSIDTRNGSRFLVGVKGDLTDNWAYDAYYSKSNLDQTNVLKNDVSNSRFQQALLVTDDGLACQDTSGGCAPLNIWGAGNISQEAIDFINISASNLTSIEQEVIQGTIAGETQYSLPSTDRNIAVVVGYEHRADKSSFTPDSFLSGGDVLGFNAGLPTVGRVSVGEIFTEASIPLVGDKLDFWVAARNSNYSTAVSSVNSYATALNWTVNDYAKVRVGFQQAVRAPNVAELFGGQSNGFPGATDPCFTTGHTAETNDALCILAGVDAADVNVIDQANTQIQGLFGGNSNLKEEESETFTIGAVITPIDGLDITVDYYDIEITDAIGTIGVGNLLDLCYNDSTATDLSSKECQLVTRRPDGQVRNVIDTNTNTGSISTSGIDLNVNYSRDLGFGINNASELSVQFKSTFLDSFEIVSFTGDEPFDCAGGFGNTCGSPLTETLWNARTTWSTGDWTVSSLLRYIGETTDDQITVGGTSASDLVVPTLDAEYYLDLSARYDFSDALAVTFGINNILDTKPTQLGNSQEQANTFPSTYDLFGPRAFVSASYKFF